MQQSNPISTWLVLGPIYNNSHQGASHSPGDGHPLAADIIMDIDNNPVRPRQLTRLLDRAPQEGDKVTYGNGIIYNNQTYAWRALNFANMNWQNIKEIEDNIHRYIDTGPDAHDPFSPLSFIGKHHALAFFLVYIESPDSRTTRLCIRSDDSVRVWLNGKEIEELRYAGERDITQWSNETYVPVTLSKGHNILMAAVAETHVEWGFSARFENDQDLRITTTKPKDTSQSEVVTTLSNTGRKFYKATYVPIRVPHTQSAIRGIPTKAFEKANFIGSLAIHPSELPILHAKFSEKAKDAKKQAKEADTEGEILQTLETIGSFVNDTSPGALLRAAPYFAKIDSNALGHLGDLLAQVREVAAQEADAFIKQEHTESIEKVEPQEITRKKQLNSAASSTSALVTISPSLTAALQSLAIHIPEQVTALTDLSSSSRSAPAIAVTSEKIQSLKTVVPRIKARAKQTENLVKNFLEQIPNEPVGWLHLERLEMYPDGIERGELVYTVPLAPKETINIIHKEWSTTTQEFEKIVQDEFEGYSEQGVAEKHELAQAVESQSRHATAFNVSSTVTGSFPMVTVTSTGDYHVSNDESRSAKESQNHSTSLTRKASARTKKDYKVTFKVTSVVGSENQSVRVITNPSDTNAMRIDYFQLMRRWKVNLYRYGLRLTYDIAIPAPGYKLRKKVEDLWKIEEEIDESFEFKPPENDKLREVAAKNGVYLEDMPEKKLFNEHFETPWISRPDSNSKQFVFEIDIGPDYELIDAEISAYGDVYKPEAGKADWVAFVEFVYGNQTCHPLPPPADASIRCEKIVLDTNAFTNKSGKIAIRWFMGKVILLKVDVRLTARRKEEAYENWKLKAWTAIRQVAEQAYYQNLNNLRDKRIQIIEELSQFDALTLRKMEREEIMKEVLKYFFGDIFKDILQEGETVKFIHNAVEWENMLYFMYPYFWDRTLINSTDQKANDKEEKLGKLLFLNHPDPNHRIFLRSGRSRVVITVRPGFEGYFLDFVATGIIPQYQHPANSPYVTIGEEIQNYAKTNYEHIPSVNHEKHARPLLYPQQRKAWDDMKKLMQLLEIYKQNSPNKNYPTTEQGLEVLRSLQFPVTLPGGHTIDEFPSLVDPWGNDYIYTSPGQSGDYDLVCYGANGKPGGTDLDADISSAAEASLIATWYEYTPTSALDISINTAPSELV